MQTIVQDTVGHHVGGRALTAGASRFGDVYDPASGQRTRRVAFASAADVDAAVRAARGAFPAWAETPPVRRAAILFAFRELVVRDTDRLAALITSEHGKTLADARGEVQRGLEVIEFACGIPHLLKGEVTENVAREVDSTAVRQPLGVCAGITPFNFPAMVPMWMFPIALACGNAFVLKPSEKDPSPSVVVAELLREAGLPDGVFNVVHGDREAVDALLAHPGRRGGEFRRLDAGRRVRLPHGHGERQARSGAGRREEPSRRHAGRGPRSGRRRADGRGVRLRGRALHGDLGRGRRRRCDRRRARRAPRGARAPSCASAPARRRTSKWVRS